MTKQHSRQLRNIPNSRSPLRKAKARGLIVFVLEPEGSLPFHFVTCDKECISLVRVHRLKYAGYSVPEIGYLCRNNIAMLRSPVTEDIFRELWVRGPDRHWYRYLMLPDSVEFMEDEERPEENDRQEGGGESPSPSVLKKRLRSRANGQ
jgi:hypothetical protein